MTHQPPLQAKTGYPSARGMYDPAHEHDACGIGFVAHIKGVASHDIVRQGLTVLSNLDHRGARGCEMNTGDGAGILLQIPDRLLREEMSAAGVELPERGRYGVGMMFLPPDDEHRLPCEQQLADIVEEEGLRVLGWRSLPLGDADLGTGAGSCEPAMRQIFIGYGDSEPEPSSNRAEAELALERRLYVVTKRASHEIRHRGEGPGGDYFYCASLSCRTIVYKGHVDAGPGRWLLRGSVRSAHGIRHRHGSFTLQHEHLSQLGTCSSIPLRHPQRRNQTPCAAMRIGCGRGSRCCSPSCSETTSTSFFPSSRKTDRTLPSWTIASNFCTCRVALSPMP